VKFGKEVENFRGKSKGKVKVKVKDPALANYRLERGTLEGAEGWAPETSQCGRHHEPRDA
jgi:hypothetical protein